MTSASDEPRGAWFAAGLALLASEGYGGLKLAAVCRALGVTTGGFYHRFGSWQDYTTGLLDTWRHDRTTALAEVARAEPDPLARLQVLVDAAIGLDHAPEAAIRAWSRVDPDVARVQALVDAERYDVVVEAMRAVVGPEEADHFAAWGFSVLVGFEQLAPALEREALVWSLLQILDVARRYAAGRGPA